MTPSPTVEDLTLSKTKIGYQNETFQLDEKCTREVQEGFLTPSSGRCQCNKTDATKCTLTSIDIASEKTRQSTESRAAEGERRKNRNNSVENSKATTDADVEKNDPSFSHTSLGDRDQDDEEAEAPEGGWGYVVILGAFIVGFIAGLLTMCFGILFIGFLLEEKASLTTTTALITTHTSVTSLSFLLAGPLMARWGWRVVVMGGGVLLSSGLIITAFTPSVNFLFFSYSLLTGLGIGVSIMAALAIPSFYFKRRRGTANAIVLCGIPTGTFVGPYIVSYLQLHYAFRGAILITAAITLHVCLSATVFHPVQWHTSGRVNRKGASIDNSSERTIIKTLTYYWRLLRSTRTFIIIFAFAATNGVMKTAVSLVPLVLEKSGQSREDAVFITSLLGVCGLVGRLVIPSCTDMAWFDVRLLGYIPCLFVAIISLIVFSMTENINWIAAAMALLGVSMSGCYSLGPLMMVRYMGLKNLVPLLALSGITTAVFQPSINPLYGVFETLSGGYSGPILFLSGQAALAMILWLLMPIAEAFDKRRMTS